MSSQKFTERERDTYARRLIAQEVSTKDVVASLKVHPTTLSKWKASYKARNANGHKPKKVKRVVVTREAKIQRLKAEIQKLNQDIDRRKKAIADLVIG